MEHIVSEKEIEALKRYRKENFAVIVKEEKGNDKWSISGKTLVLQVTTNGSQFQNIAFESQEEIDKVIKALQECNIFK